ncbi:MAG: hypothetical protein Q4D42_10625 [Eubacteriales bacterium]|nr:hypothetical protein [Eubacteriales bacterium]
MSKKSDERKILLNGSMAKTKYEMNKASMGRLREKKEYMQVVIPKGERDIWKSYAASKGKSLNQYIIDLVHADMGGAPELPANGDAE